ncbi:hypothetical protein BDR26DRAFT_850641 [Obelidium mucronatum]|nr:hypothetical protein BDR26DRAFT_850641 [Obelidium mucronatum]
MGFVSIGVIWWGVQRQDKEAMKNTISGKSKEETKWMWQWFNNSALANPAKHDPSENASMGGPRLGERSSGGSNKSGSGQPSVFAKERREFQQFDDTGSPIPPEPVAAAAAAGFTQQQYNSHSRRSHPRRERRGSSANDNPHMKSRSQSRSPIRHQSPHRADHYQQETQGVDPFAEMMGGGPPVTMDSAVPAYHAVFEFYGVAGSPDLEHVRVGDRLVVLEVKPNGFGVARNLNTGKQGLVPMNILSR